jgi:molecular chaperone GrpE
MDERQTSQEQIENGDAQTEQAQESATTPQLSAEELQARLMQIEQESTSYRDQYLRATADLKNFKRRTEEERASLIRNATAGLIMKLLPIVDDFELAMQHAPAEVRESPWFSGVEGVQRKLQLVLEGEGVRPIEAEGQPFDPNFHDAVMREDAGPVHAGRVVQDLRRGYLLHDKVIRPSMVKVGQE